MKLVVALCVMTWSSLVAADAAKAKQLNTEGMKLYGKKDYPAALASFTKAIAEDPTFVLAHYNAASMASLAGDFPRVVKELEWLTASKDASAAKALAQGKTDRDLDRASMHPRVRELVGLPPLDKVDLGELLTERGGLWGADASACAGLAVNAVFKKGGKVSIQSEFACDATDANQSETGTWVVKGGKLVVKSKLIFPDGISGELAKCPADEGGIWCLAIDGNGFNAMHRGPGTMH